MPAGRPTIVTEEVIAQLESAFKDGANIVQACILANISKDAYYDRLKTDSEFSNRMEAAQQWVSVIARSTLVKEIKRGNSDTALKWLERKDKAEFAPRTELTGSEGVPLGYVYSSDVKKLESPEVIQIEPEQPKQLPQ